MNKSVRQIACSQCGAPLDLHGGHRSRSLNCGHCGAVMDKQQDYQVVQRYKNMPRPHVPLKIGMTAKLKSVDFVIIGLVAYLSEDIYRWVDFQLYSPTHGYVWLTYNEGHYVFSRRVRSVPNPATITAFYPKKAIKAMGHSLLAYEQYKAKITYVEGELTWIAKRGDKIEATEAIDPPYLFSYETSQNELEYNFGEYISAKEVHQAFAIDPPSRTPSEIHPAQPYVPNRFLASAFIAAKYHLIVLALILLVLTFLGNGSSLLKQMIDLTEIKTVRSQDFQVDDAEHLIKLNITVKVRNNWGFYNIEIYNKNTNELVYSLAKEIAYYEGYEGGEYWSEGNTDASALFKLPAAGDYYAQISGEGPATQLPSLYLTLYQGVIVTRYFWLLAIFMLIMLVLSPIRRQLFEQKRWQPILGDD